MTTTITRRVDTSVSPSSIVAAQVPVWTSVSPSC